MSTNGYILVTGSAGFIAFHLIEDLLRSGQPVIGLDNFDAFYDRKTKEKNLADLKAISESTGTSFEFFEMSLDELKANSFSNYSIQSVVHLAAKAGVRPSLEQPDAYVTANVMGTVKILEFCRLNKILNLVFGSSSSVYGDSSQVPFNENEVADQPISPYAASKRSCEMYCSTYAHLYGLKIASLRFFTVYGPRQRPDLAIHKFAKLIRDGKTLTLFGDGSTSRDYTWVKDIIFGVRGAMKWVEDAKSHTHEVFNLGGSATTTLIQLVRLIEQNLGVQAKIEWQPRQPGDVERTFADTKKSAQYFGYAPKVPIADGIKMFAEWFKAL